MCQRKQLSGVNVKQSGWLSSIHSDNLDIEKQISHDHHRHLHHHVSPFQEENWAARSQSPSSLAIELTSIENEDIQLDESPALIER